GQHDDVLRRSGILGGVVPRRLLLHRRGGVHRLHHLAARRGAAAAAGQGAVQGRVVVDRAVGGDVEGDAVAAVGGEEVLPRCQLKVERRGQVVGHVIQEQVRSGQGGGVNLCPLLVRIDQDLTETAVP